MPRNPCKQKVELLNKDKLSFTEFPLISGSNMTLHSIVIDILYI